MPTTRSTTARGYGATHQQLRRQAARTVNTGEATCPRCGNPITPGEPWDLGHTEGDRTTYQGPEHRHCNRQAGGRNGATTTNTHRTTTTRDW